MQLKGVISRMIDKKWCFREKKRMMSSEDHGQNLNLVQNHENEQTYGIRIGQPCT